MIMGYCKFANCTRSIQIKVIDVRKLELQYSGGELYFLPKRREGIIGLEITLVPKVL